MERFIAVKIAASIALGTAIVLEAGHHNASASTQNTNNIEDIDSCGPVYHLYDQLILKEAIIPDRINLRETSVVEIPS